MIIGMQLPDGATVKQTADGRLLIIIDEQKSKRDLWKARSDIWVTEGFTEEEFFENKLLDNKCLELSKQNKLKLSSY